MPIIASAESIRNQHLRAIDALTTFGVCKKGELIEEGQKLSDFMTALIYHAKSVITYQSIIMNQQIGGASETQVMAENYRNQLQSLMDLPGFNESRCLDLAGVEKWDEIYSWSSEYLQHRIEALASLRFDFDEEGNVCSRDQRFTKLAAPGISDLI